MVDQVQSSPSPGTLHSSGSTSPQELKLPQVPARERSVSESLNAKKNSLSPLERALEQQKQLNSLTVPVRRAVTEGSNPQEVIRESLRIFIEGNQPAPVEPVRTSRNEGADREMQIQVDGKEKAVAELMVPGSRGDEKVQLEGSLPEPSLPQRRKESGEVDLSGPRGEVVNVVS